VLSLTLVAISLGAIVVVRRLFGRSAVAID
jgi:hypothetical protein